MDNVRTASSSELEKLLRDVRNTAHLPTFRNIDKVTNPAIRRVWKACDRIEELAAQGRITVNDIPLLYATTANANDHVAGSLGIAVSAMGVPAINCLIDLLDHVDDKVRTWASWILGTVIGEPALPYLQRAVLDSAKRESAFISIWCTRQLGMNIVVGFLDDDDYTLRNAAAIALATWNALYANTERDTMHLGIEALLAELLNEDSRVSESAAFGLGYRGGVGLDQAMMKLPVLGIVRDLDWDEPSNAFMLARLLDPETGISSADRQARIDAASYAGSEGNPIAIPILLKYVRSEEDDVARGAIFSMLWRLSKLSVR